MWYIKYGITVLIEVPLVAIVLILCVISRILWELHRAFVWTINAISEQLMRPIAEWGMMEYPGDKTENEPGLTNADSNVEMCPNNFDDNF